MHARAAEVFTALGHGRDTFVEAKIQRQAEDSAEPGYRRWWGPRRAEPSHDQIPEELSPVASTLGHSAGPRRVARRILRFTTSGYVSQQDWRLWLPLVCRTTTPASDHHTRS